MRTCTRLAAGMAHRILHQVAQDHLHGRGIGQDRPAAIGATCTSSSMRSPCAAPMPASGALQPAAQRHRTARPAARRLRCAPAPASCRSAIPADANLRAAGARARRAGRPRRSPRPAAGCWSAACAAHASPRRRKPACRARADSRASTARPAPTDSASSSSTNTDGFADQHQRACAPIARRRHRCRRCRSAPAVRAMRCAWLIDQRRPPAASASNSSSHSATIAAIQRARRAGMTLRLPCPACAVHDLQPLPPLRAPMETPSASARRRRAVARPSCPDRRHDARRRRPVSRQLLELCAAVPIDVRRAGGRRLGAARTLPTWR